MQIGITIFPEVGDEDVYHVAIVHRLLFLAPSNVRIQRRALFARPLERIVRCRVASDILSSDLKASLTAAELRNALATSGSSTTTFDPCFRRRR
jgi:hypothetical protein